MDSNIVKSFDSSILNASHIVVLVHKSPDVDAIGSISAFAAFFNNHYLRINSAVDIKFIIPDSIPNFLNWLVVDKNFININDCYTLGKIAILNADVLICMDMNQPTRIGPYYDFFSQSNAFKINIDHHPYKSDVFNLVIRDCGASSTSEIIYDLFSNIDAQSIDIHIANALYAGILGDTGSFSYSCDRESTYFVTAALINKGVDVRHVHDLVFNNYPYERTLLLGYVLYNKFKFKYINDDIIAYFYLTEHELQEHGYVEGYLEGVINYALNIQNVKIAASFVERNNVIRISLRSKQDIYVNDFAEKYFGGGGHPNASGATVNNKSLMECVDLYENNIYECLK